jgi:UDP-2,4-diacetamido-2,4,6-trideoxy-beta-L-altropyranose hydrolase
MIKILIRVDANNKIGLGHLVRCQALASMLKNEFEILFVCKEIPNQLFTEIINSGIQILKINSEIEVFKILKEFKIVVVDNYNLDTNYQKKIKEIGCKLVCIDDVHDKEFYADVIINHSDGVLQDDYKCKEYTKLYLGKRYALLRPPFLLASLVKNRKVHTLNKCFVCFGGSDFENYTLDTVKKLVKIDTISTIYIVIGSEYLYLNTLKLFCETYIKQRIIIYRNLNSVELVNVIINSDFAIVPSSSILYEVLSVKIPVVSGYTISNQKLIYQSLVDEGVIVGIGSFPLMGIEDKLKRLSLEKHKILKKQNITFDGKSSERILNIFKELSTK